MYKLIALDMDGTALNSDGMIIPENVEAIKYAKSKNVHVAVCTGRNIGEASELCQLLGCDAFGINSSGGAISDFKNGRNIRKFVYSAQIANKVCEIFGRHGFSCVVYGDCNTYLDRKVFKAFEHRVNKGFTDSLVVVDDLGTHIVENNVQVDKIFAYNDDLRFISSVREELSLIDEIDVTSSFFNNLEVVKKGASKGKALSILASMYGTDVEHTIAIGDNFNDLDMLKVCGMSVAMRNAPAEICDQCKFVTDTNDECGVAKAIYHFCR